MTRKEEIKAKADELGQSYFPDECNVWARGNIEAKFVSSACIQMAEWMQRKMIEKACEWLKFNTNWDDEWDDMGKNMNYGMIEEFRKAMEE